MKLKIVLGSVLLMLAFLPLRQAQTTSASQYWLKIAAQDKFERSVIANAGVAIEIIRDDYVIAIGSEAEKNRIEKMGKLVASSVLMSALDFPTQDAEYHNYAELKKAIEDIHAKYPELTQIFSIGKSLEGRDILGLRISGNLAQADDLAAVLYVGGHHAREHLSVETPLRIVQKILENYASGDAKIMALIDHRDIHVIPALNVDGLEFDIASGRYQYWRKNRAKNRDGTYGVDLNRNYGFQWGTGGSSKDPSSDVYMGPAPFSEPETIAFKNYVEAHTNISTLLSFHTFSKLILYPWGHSNDAIPDKRDLQVFEKMAKKMASFNGYTPQQSSDLYIASGDTVDWAYGAHKIIAFTFELDPGSSAGQGGFYPGAKIIPQVVEKNYPAFLYLLEYADNPHRVLESGGIDFGRSL